MQFNITAPQAIFAGACTRLSQARRQSGFTLLELMVGITVGLLVVAVAAGALMVSRGVSGTVSDASGIQQQSAYAMRVIGLQLRQAGSLFLNTNPQSIPASAATAAPVAFETKAPASGSANGFDPAINTLSAASGVLTVGYRRYKEPVYAASTDQALSRNCIGSPGNNSADQRVESIFQLNGSELRCSGNGSSAQPIVQNVANFQVRYLLQNNAVANNPTIQYVAADAVGAGNWSKVQAVEVCLVFYGSERIDMPAGSTYTDCDGTAVDMTTLTGARARRMHIAYRNVFQLRSQGLVGSVL